MPKSKKKTTRLNTNFFSKVRNKKLIVILIIIVIGMLGYKLLFGLHAQGPYSSAEAENGTITGLASLQTSLSVSGSKYL